MRDTPIDRPLCAVALEMSLKPVRSYDEDSLRSLAHEIASQWRPLLAAATSAEVMLWVADGSELLDFSGDLDERFAWGQWIGFANLDHDAYLHPVPPERQAIPYTAEPAQPSYADLRLLVAILREVISDDLGVPVRIGTTFDTGPEFADSDFKYVRHPELVARGADVGIESLVAMLRHGARLHADTRSYAAFPDGVPADTSLGTFLGRQAEVYLPAIGFDYLWLSNGFGFSSYAWTDKGSAFDGTRFDSDAARTARTATLQFWDDFGREFSGEVRVRGTNHSAGIDIGSDGVPALEIYEHGTISMPPPNSPWGPLNLDFGIELTGFMSRIASIPGRSFMFRFYANDPWFWQQPWWDFYHRETFDIDLMTSVARLTDDGGVQAADHIQILSIDTSRGELDERCGREVSTAILQSLEARPDEAGPLVWVYPFREYHAAPLTGEASDLARVYSEDLLLTAAVNAGLPVNTVCSTDALAAARASGALSGRALVAPTSVLRRGHADHSSVRDELAGHVRTGGDVLLYGSLRGLEEIAAGWLGLTIADEALEGVASLRGLDRLALDTVHGVPAAPALIQHSALLSDGGLEAVAGEVPDDSEIVVSAEIDGVRRAYVVTARPQGSAGGRLVWVRGSGPATGAAGGAEVVAAAPRRLHPGTLLRAAAGLLGIVVRHEFRDPASPPAVTTLHRSRGAYWLSGYAADTTATLHYRLPGGAPVLATREGYYGADGTMGYAVSKSLHAECRVLIERGEPGVVSCHDLAPQPAEMIRSIEVTGLRDADLVLLPPPGTVEHCRVVVNGQRVHTPASAPGQIRLRGVTGVLSLSW